VTLVDRMKDMINRGGENVYCVEVENVLAGAPAVYEAAVLGVPDEMMGEKVGAVIVPMPGVTLDVAAVLDYLGAHIADFKIPEYVAVSSAPLPRNPGGKLLKRRLREDTDWPAAAVRRLPRRKPGSGGCAQAGQAPRAASGAGSRAAARSPRRGRPAASSGPGRRGVRNATGPRRYGRSRSSAPR
jgi:AMP-binding enzyme C-terminal domain